MRTLLVSKKNKDFSERLHNVLNAADNYCFSTQTAKSAYEKYCKRRFDAVILDIDNIKKSCLSLTKKLHTLDRKVKIIIISATEDVSLILKALTIDVTAFLKKPIHMEHLLKLLRGIEKTALTEKYQTLETQDRITSMEDKNEFLEHIGDGKNITPFPIDKPSSFLHILSSVFQFLVSGVLYFTAAKLFDTFLKHIDASQLHFYIRYFILSSGSMVILCRLFIIKKNIAKLNYFRILNVSTQTVAASFIIGTFILYITGDTTLKRNFLLINFGIQLIGQILFFWLVKYFQHISKLIRAFTVKKVLIVGACPNAAQIAEEINNRYSRTHEVSGYLFFNKKTISSQIKNINILGSIKKLASILDQNVIDEIVFVLRKDNIKKTKALIKTCSIRGKKIKQYYVFENNVFPDNPISFSYTEENIKRIFDIAFGLIGFFVFMLLYIIIGPIIKITSSGPVLFKQPRIGINNRIFYLYKFRTMHEGADKKKPVLKKQNIMKGAIFKIKNDPRITKFGTFLRKYSIDEFPRFIKVLKSEMSIVGTRPPTPDEVEKYKTWHLKRITIKPGITGLWQISGRNKISDFDEIVNLDLKFIDGWSLKWEIKIIMQTIPIILKGEGL
jgi:exopolysaccharide biosynthesis polyprenyl glycosylphosphotransferase